MDCLRMGTQRAEFLQALEAKMIEEQEEWQRRRREEQTPNAEWGIFIRVLRDTAERFFAGTVQRSPDYPQQAQHILELLRQRRRLRLELTTDISSEA
eukprot:37811-Pyramimonas_sp.AAC.1